MHGGGSTEKWRKQKNSNSKDSKQKLCGRNLVSHPRREESLHNLHVTLKGQGEDSGKLDLPPAARASLEKDQGGLKTWRLEAEEPRGWDRKGTYPGDETSLRDSLWRRSSSSRVILRLWKMKRMKLKTKK